MQLHSISGTDSPDFARVLALYERAFPENERKELRYLVKPNQFIGEILAIREGEVFVGFCAFLNLHDISHIIYFAIEEALRNQGLGGQALDLITERKKGQRILADLEDESAAAENSEQRRRRVQFYLRHGFAQTQVAYRWCGEDYRILAHGGDVTPAEFHGFWEELSEVDPEMLY